ncbi:MAG TPA: 4-(cytidine 5'-diphospho)-2-C-methyl-D-erythritol kinase [Bryobacteraceae bacterium]|nr:4-(cytidine 5'-diphospho)-2-C-methyl-D-erythritol kinase [Bryobacteraceae bacterium]
MRSVVVPSFAKLNLDLRVLHKRADGYHELRTIFQTISLKDTLEIGFSPQKRTNIELASSIDIADNLVIRSSKMVLDYLEITGHVRLVLTKKIPMGAGLGGGSSNAAAVLLALPRLIRAKTGKQIAYADLVRLAESLGSDVPFFLRGGTALGLGKGTEVYPLPDQPSRPALVLTTGIHVSTALAYEGINRTLTQPGESPMLGEFQTVAWELGPASLSELPLANDFEESVFKAHPRLAKLTRKLSRLGARPARMTGSGSALFGIFTSVAAVKSAASHFPADSALPVRFVTRQQYARAWSRALAGELTK